MKAKKIIFNCEWKKNGFCRYKDCPEKECDLFNLPYELNEIKKRLKEELKFIKKYRKDKSKKKDVVDKINGIKILSTAYIKIKRTKK